MRVNLHRLVPVAIAALVLTVACAPPASTTGGQSPQAAAQGAKKKITTATLKPEIKGLATIIDGDADLVAELIHAGLTRQDVQNSLHPQLAEAVPTTTNGLWKVNADGTMETTWKIRADAKWHDGTPVTSADLAFSTKVQQDRDLGITIHNGYSSMDSVLTPDPATVTVKWKRPYIQADVMFGHYSRLLPQHILESAYGEGKDKFLAHPYWTEQYVGAGAFKVREYARGSHLLLDANPAYVLGRPKVDEIEVKFIGDSSTLLANLLSGAVDVTFGLGIAPDQAVQIREQWREGTVAVSPYADSSAVIFIQFLNPTPSILSDARFRRAMAHAIDRDVIVETIMSGIGIVAHGPVPPSVPYYDDVQGSVMKYPYDQRRAEQLLDEIGYKRISDGRMADASGQQLGFEIRGVQEEQERVRSSYVAADYWRRLGINVESLTIPARGPEPEYLAVFPGFWVKGLVGDVEGIANYYHGSKAPIAENRFVGNNKSRYVNAELDGLIDRYLTTIPATERINLLRQVVRHTTEAVVDIPLFFVPYTTMISNRLSGVTPYSRNARGWSVHEWDVK